MEKPRFEVRRLVIDGKINIDLIVRDATYSPELDALTMKLGYRPVEDISNCRRVRCTTSSEIEAARTPLVSLFDAKGEWK